MKTKFVTRESQPHFPQVDLTGGDTEWLKHYLDSQAVVSEAYDEIDRKSYMMHAAFCATNYVLKNQQPYNHFQSDAVRHGMRVFGAIHHLLDSTLEVPKERIVRRRAGQIAEMNKGEMLRYADGSLLEFYLHMSQTTDLVEEVSRCVLAADCGGHAIIGAALMYQFESDVIRRKVR